MNKNSPRSSGGLCSKKEREGWLKPRRYTNMRKQHKQVSYRDAYRAMYIKKTATLMPGRNMELVTMFQWMFEGVIDLTALNSKIIMKCLYLLHIGELPFGISSKAYNHFKNHYKFCWRRPSSCRLFDRMVPFNFDSIEQSEIDPSPDGMKRFKMLLLHIVNKEGGITEIVRKERFYRPDSVGDTVLTATTCCGAHPRPGKYSCYPCEELPILKCSVCDTLNLLSHGDKNTWKQPNMGTGWRCGMCWASLEVQLDYVHPMFNIVDNYIDEMIGVKGSSQLDELLLMNYGDVYKDLNLEGRKAFYQRDLSLLRKYFHNNLQTVVEIGTNLHRDDFDKLKIDFPRLNFVMKMRSSHASKNILYEHNSILANLSGKGTIPINVYGNIDEVKPAKQLVYNVSLNSACKIIVCSNVNVSINKVVNNVLTDAYLVVPNLENTMTAYKQVKHENNYHIMCGPSGKVMVIKEELIDSLPDMDVLLHGKQAVVINRTQTTSHWIVYKLTRVNRGMNWMDYKSIKYPRNKIIRLSLPSLDKAISSNFVSLWEKQEFIFDQQFLNMLMIRNLTGKLGYESLKEFAVGYALRNFTMNSSNYKNAHIKYEMVEVHVCLSLLFTNMILSTHNSNARSANLASMPVIKSALPGLANDMTNIITNMLMFMITKYIKIDLNDFVKRLINSSSDYIENWIMNNKFVDNVDLSAQYEMSDLRLIKMSDLKPRPTKSCVHHMNCKCTYSPTKQCKCCKFARATHNGKCDCCLITEDANISNFNEYIIIKEDEVIPNKRNGGVRKEGDKLKSKIIEDLTPRKQSKVNSNKKRDNVDRIINKVTQQYRNLIIDDNYSMIEQSDMDLVCFYQTPKGWLADKELSKTPYNTVLHFVVNSGFSLTSDWIVVKNYKNVESDNYQCARKAFEEVLQVEISESDFNQAIGPRVTLVSVDEIIKVFKECKMNGLVVAKNYVKWYTHDATNKSYYTIIHGSMIPEIPDEHFVPGVCQQIDKSRGFVSSTAQFTIEQAKKCLDLLDKSESIDDLDLTDTLIVNKMLEEIVILPMIDFDKMLPTVRGKLGKLVWANNDRNKDNIITGWISMDVPDELGDCLSLLNQFDEGIENSPILPDVFDKLELIPDEPKTLIMNEIKAEIKDWLTVRNRAIYNQDLNQHDFKSQSDQYITRDGMVFTMKLFNQRIKTFDMAMIIQQNIKTIAVLKVDRLNETVYLNPRVALESGKATIKLFKKSYSSLIRKIHYSLQANISKDKYLKLMHEMKAVKGVAGAGKTYSMVRQAENSDLIITQTTRAKKNIVNELILANKERLTQNVMTLEAACTRHVVCSGTLFIDEASLMSPMSIFPLLNDNLAQVVVMGDLEQTALTDMLHEIEGERVLYQLLHVPTESNTQVLTKSYRIGPPLCYEVSKLYDQFEGNEMIKTEYDITHINGTGAELRNKFSDIVDKFQPDLISGTTNSTLDWIHSAINSEHVTIPIETTTSSQGSTVKRHLHVIRRNPSGGWGLARQIGTLRTALTRANEYVKVVMINSDSDEKEIIDLVLSSGYVGGDPKPIKKSLDRPISEQRELMAKELRNYPGMTCTIDEEDGLTYTITGPFNVVLSKFKYSNKKLHIMEGVNWVTDKILDEIDLTDVKITRTMDKVKSINIARLRALTWLSDASVGQQFGFIFTYKFARYRLSKTKGCPLAAGLKLYRKLNKIEQLVAKRDEKLILNISKEAEFGNRELIYYDDKEYLAVQLMTWLQLVTECHTYKDITTEFDDIVVPSNINEKMFAERLSRFPSCLMHLICNGCKSDTSCNGVKSVMERRNATAKKIGKELNLNIGDLEWNVHHKLILLIDGKNYYSVNNEIVECNPINSLKKTTALINKVLDDVTNIGKEDLITGELEGLSMSIESHREHKTPVYQEYVKKMSKIRDYTLDNLDNTLWISKGSVEATKLLMQEYSDVIYINEHRHLIHDKLTELLDGIMLRRNGQTHSSANACYCGFEPVLPSIYAMHHIKLWFDSALYTSVVVSRSDYERAAEQLTAYLSGIKEDKTDLNVNKLVNSQFLSDLTGKEHSVLAGTSLMYQTNEWLYTTCCKVNCIYGWVPGLDIDKRLGQLDMTTGNVYLMSQMSSIQPPVNFKLLTTLMGDRLEYNNTNLDVTVIDTMLGFHYVKVSKQPKEIHVVKIHRSLKGPKNLVKIPWINTNIRDILTSKKIFTVKVISIDPVLLRKLGMRLLIDSKTSYGDLLAYARALSSAYETSATNFRLKYSISITNLYNTVYAAWYYHDKHTWKFKIVKNMIEMYSNLSDLQKTNLFSLLTTIINTFEAISDVATNLTSQLSKIIEDKAADIGLSIKLLDETDDLLRELLDYSDYDIEIDDMPELSDDSSDEDSGNDDGNDFNDGDSDQSSTTSSEKHEGDEDQFNEEQSEDQNSDEEKDGFNDQESYGDDVESSNSMPSLEDWENESEDEDDNIHSKLTSLITMSDRYVATSNIPDIINEKILRSTAELDDLRINYLTLSDDVLQGLDELAMNWWQLLNEYDNNAEGDYKKFFQLLIDNSEIIDQNVDEMAKKWAKLIKLNNSTTLSINVLTERIRYILNFDKLNYKMRENSIKLNLLVGTMLSANGEVTVCKNLRNEIVPQSIDVELLINYTNVSKAIEVYKYSTEDVDKIDTLIANVLNEDDFELIMWDKPQIKFNMSQINVKEVGLSLLENAVMQLKINQSEIGKMLAIWNKVNITNITEVEDLLLQVSTTITAVNDIYLIGFAEAPNSPLYFLNNDSVNIRVLLNKFKHKRRFLKLVSEMKGDHIGVESGMSRQIGNLNEERLVLLQDPAKQTKTSNAELYINIDEDTEKLFEWANNALLELAVSYATSEDNRQAEITFNKMTLNDKKKIELVIEKIKTNLKRNSMNDETVVKAIEASTEYLLTQITSTELIDLMKLDKLLLDTIKDYCKPMRLHVMKDKVIYIPLHERVEPKSYAETTIMVKHQKQREDTEMKVRIEERLGKHKPQSQNKATDVSDLNNLTDIVDKAIKTINKLCVKNGLSLSDYTNIVRKLQIGSKNDKVEMIQSLISNIRVILDDKTLTKFLEGIRPKYYDNTRICSCKRRHIIVSVTGSTGEIMPIHAIAKVLANKTAYHVVFNSVNDPRIVRDKLIAYKLYSQNVTLLMLAVMKMGEIRSAGTALVLNNILNDIYSRQFSMLNSVQFVITNYTNYYGPVMAADCKCQLITIANSLHGRFDDNNAGKLTVDNTANQWLVDIMSVGCKLIAHKHRIDIDEVSLNHLTDSKAQIYTTYNVELVKPIGYVHDFTPIMLNDYEYNLASEILKPISEKGTVGIIFGSGFNNHWHRLIKELVTEYTTIKISCAARDYDMAVDQLAPIINDDFTDIEVLKDGKNAKLFRCGIIVHHCGVAVTMCSIVNQPIVVGFPQFDEQKGNYKILSKYCKSSMFTIGDSIIKKITEAINDEQPKLAPVEPMPKPIVELNILKLVSSGSEVINCKCSKKHTLLHFVGTQGDLNSIVPACNKVLGDTHVICITHIDLMTILPSNWLKVPILTDSIQTATIAAELMDLKNPDFIGGLANYHQMQQDSMTAITKVKCKIDFCVTNFFSPFSTTLARKLQAIPVLIDAIPNRMFYHDSHEIVTGLPITYSEVGNSIRNALLESTDKFAMKEDPIPLTEQLEVVTCHPGLYRDFVNMKGVYRVYINPQTPMKVDSGKLNLLLSPRKTNVLITFGSIPTKNRIKDLTSLIIDNCNIIFSGLGNKEHFKGNKKYISKLNYPADLLKFDVIVHHGGVGTTMNCIHANKYQIIWPIFGDQYLWAKIVGIKNVGHEVKNIDQLKERIENYTITHLKVNNLVTENCKLITSGVNDDTNLVKEMLGLRVVNPVITDLLPSATSGVNIGRKLALGDHVEKSFKRLETLYDPITIDGCTIKSIVSLADVNDMGLGPLFNWTNPSLEQLKLQLKLLRCNYVLFMDSQFLCMEVINEMSNLIELNIKYTPNGLHCVACRAIELLTVVNGIKRVRPDITMLQNLQQDLDINVTAESFTQWFNKVKTRIDELERRSIDLANRLIRRTYPLTILVVQSAFTMQGLTFIKCEPSIGLSTDDICYIINIDNGVGCYCVMKKSADYCILMLTTKIDTNFSKELLLFKLESMKQADLASPTLIVPNETTYFCNHLAKSMNKIAAYAHCAVYRNQTDYELILNATDNRQHDYYDHRKLAEKAKKVILPKNVKQADYEKYFLSERETHIRNGIFVLFNEQPHNQRNISRNVSLASLQQTDYLQINNKLFVKPELLNDKVLKQLLISDEPEVKTTDLTGLCKYVIDGDELKSLLESVNDKTWALDEETILTSKEVGAAMVANALYNASTKSVITTKPLLRYVIVPTGGLPTIADVIKTEVVHKGADVGKWFGGDKRPGQTNEQINVNKSVVTMVDTMQWHIHNKNLKPIICNGRGMKEHAPYIPSTNHSVKLKDGSCTEDEPHYDAMVFWSDTDVTNYVQLYAPTEGKVRSVEHAERVMDSTKHTLSKYPKWSRPVLTKLVYEENRSVAGRLFSVKHVRKYKPDPVLVVRNIIKAFFHDEAEQQLKDYQKETISYDAAGTRDWLLEHKQPGKVYEELIEIFNAQLTLDSISNIKVHLKLEALLKDVDKVIFRWEKQQARIIAWQRYAIAAIFSPIFLSVKKRLHSLLNNKVLYADGKRPDELGDWLKTKNKTKYYIENDLTKQDRQTDDNIIEAEMLLYVTMGVHPDVIACWSRVHGDWKLRASKTSGWRSAMRTTGQATTAIGNVITNMQTMCEFVLQNWDHIDYIILLGDDNNIGMQIVPSLATMRKQIAQNYNMQSKLNINPNVGNFCQLLTYRNSNGQTELGPDYIRLKNRFEVTNGVSEATDENIVARAQSYCQMLGATEEVKELIKLEKWPLKPTMWYDQLKCIEASATYNKTSIENVIKHYNLLINMLTERHIYTHTFTHFTSKPRRS